MKTVALIFLPICGRAHARMIQDWQRPPSGPNRASTSTLLRLYFLATLWKSACAYVIKDWQHPLADPMNIVGHIFLPHCGRAHARIRNIKDWQYPPPDPMNIVGLIFCHIVEERMRVYDKRLAASPT
jgi:hypothetical protein